MKRYSFRLATVLRLRRAEESHAREHLIATDTLLREAIVDRDREAHRYASIAPSCGAMSLDSLRESQFAMELAAYSLAGAQQKVTKCAADAALAQIAWSASSRKVKVIERLDERRRIEHMATNNKIDRDLVDDLVTTRYVLDQLNNEIDVAS